MSGTPIALLTDYGLRDAYVGVLHAVIRDRWPWATVFDISHDVPPQNLLSGAWILASAVPYLPQACIVCAVVDPGVGTGRRAVVVETRSGLRFVAPDNGLLGLALSKDPARRAVVLDQERWFLRQRSVTFDGRDIFAPVAAQLARGVRLEALGSALELDELVALDLPEPVGDAARMQAVVLHVDHFGNVITSRTGRELENWRGTRSVRASLPGRGTGPSLPFVRTFADVAVGDGLCYVGSAGHVELAVRDGDCADAFDVAQRDRVDFIAS